MTMVHTEEVDAQVRKTLREWIAGTERAFRSALRAVDVTADCEIRPSLDIGFPHDAVRLAAGFPTGCLVRWHSSVPVIPIDTTVNVCTSSLFLLEGDVDGMFDADSFRRLEDAVARSSYVMNFHRGNHFIAIARRRATGEWYLVLHSSASEFKKGYNGLYPVPGNWYMDRVRSLDVEGRRMRIVVGDTAEMFFKLAKQVEAFNATRHSFLANVLTQHVAPIATEVHHHHYFMPSASMVVIGSFLAEEGSVVPIFSFPGDPILLWEVIAADRNKVDVDGKPLYLVPHGWGKTSRVPASLAVDLRANLLLVNGESFPMEVDTSLRAHPDLVLRRYGFSEDGRDYYPSMLRSQCDGRVVDLLDQRASYNKAGFKLWP